MPTHWHGRCRRSSIDIRCSQLPAGARRCAGTAGLAPAGEVLTRHDVAGLDGGQPAQTGAAGRGPALRSGARPTGAGVAVLARAGRPCPALVAAPHHHRLLVTVGAGGSATRALRGAAQWAPLPPLPSPAEPGGGSCGRRASRPRDPVTYWRRELAGSALALDLPTTFPRPRLQSLRGATHELRIDPAAVARLDAFARRVEVTRFIAVLAGFGALLARYAGDDVVVGVPTAGRSDAASAHQIGYFVNPVPVRIRVGPRCTFRELVGRVRETLLMALDHAVAFPTLVEAMGPARDPSRSPLMQTAVALQVAPVGRPDLSAFAVADEHAHIHLGEFDLSPYRLTEHGSPLDLSLALAEVDGALAGAITYCTDLFDPPAIARLAGHLTTLLRRVVADPDVPLAQQELMDEAERAAVLALADGGRASFTTDGREIVESEGSPAQTMPALLARQVLLRPDAVALRYGQHVLTYADLDQRASRLAALLVTRYGVRPNTVVGVHTAHGVDPIVAFWAVVKAGGAYLPLATDLPRTRLHWLVSDAQPVVVITDATTSSALPASGPPQFRIDSDWPAPPEGPSLRGSANPEGRRSSRSQGRFAGSLATNSGAELRPDDCAYVLYTSGTTGRPKGVLVPHRGAINTAQAVATALELSATDRVVQYASCAYDVSILEILIAHARGAALYPVPAEAAVPGPALLRLLAEEQITAAVFSPSALAALPDSAVTDPPLPELVRLVVGGETCTPELVSRWAPGRRFINAYGPTEASICATLTICTADGRRPPIGRPLPNVRTYVLDAALDPVPVGLTGELYIGGAAVAQGTSVGRG